MGIRSALICAAGVAVMSLTSTATAQGQKNGPGVHNISIPASRWLTRSTNWPNKPACKSFSHRICGEASQ